MNSRSKLIRVALNGRSRSRHSTAGLTNSHLSAFSSAMQSPRRGARSPLPGGERVVASATGRGAARDTKIALFYLPDRESVTPLSLLRLARFPLPAGERERRFVASPQFSQTFVVRRRRVAWMRGARRFCDEGIVDTMSRSEIAVQRSRQAAIRRLAAKVCEKCG